MSKMNELNEMNEMNEANGTLVPPSHWTAYGASTRYAAHCLGDGQGPCPAAARPARTPYAVDAWMAEHRNETGHARFTLATSATADLTDLTDLTALADCADLTHLATSVAGARPRAGHGPGADWVPTLRAVAPTLRAVAPALRLLAVVVLARADQGWSRVFDRALTRLNR
ncbi:hypothetical protein AB0F42_29515 [Streptomyces buecherae]|uniref:hypothetical protein n=1 Tax=Streptomyces buecherae TaxID=2763006 RepID=UPI0033BFEF7A